MNINVVEIIRFETKKRVLTDSSVSFCTSEKTFFSEDLWKNVNTYEEELHRI